MTGVDGTPYIYAGLYRNQRSQNAVYRPYVYSYQRQNIVLHF